MSDESALSGELLDASQMSEVEWLEYETLILEVSDFSDTSEIDGLLCMAWLNGGEMLTPAFLARYFRESEDPKALPRTTEFVQRHADWVRLRCARQPDQLPPELPPLSFDFDPEAERWSVCFDPQLWLLGWQRGVEDFDQPEFNGDSRVDQAYELICMAAEFTAEMFADEALDEEIESPIDLDQGDYAEQLLDLASPEELAISEGVMMAVSLAPQILPMLREDDGVAQDDVLFQLDEAIELAMEQLRTEHEAIALEDGEGWYGARMDWVNGRDDRLPEAFHLPSDRGRLASQQIDAIHSLWRTEIEAQGGLPFEYVDGFLSAHSISPKNDSYDLQHTLYPLIGEQVEDMEEDRVLALIRALQEFMGHINARVLLDDSVQLMGVPAQVDRYLEEDDSVAAGKLGERWSEGLRAGLSHFCPMIGSYLEQDKLLFALMLPLLQLSFQPEGIEYEFSLAERRELIAGIPETLNQIAGRLQQQARTPVRKVTKVGRNDPCPCGSGKKYKKCCGAS